MELKLNKTDYRIRMYKDRLINSIITFLFVASVILLPFDAIRFMSSTYRPISIFPIALLFIFTIPKFVTTKLDKPTICIIFFFVLANVLSFACFDYSDFQNCLNLFFDFFLTTTLMVMVFISFNTVFKSINTSGSYIDLFPKLICFAYVIPICIAFIDALGIYGILPIGVSQGIHSVFGGSQTTRICGFTLEASWLTMHLLFCMPAYLYCLTTKKLSKWYLIPLLMSIVVLVLCISMQAIFYVLIVAIVMWIASLRKNATLPKLLIPLGIAFLFVVFVLVMQNIDSDIYFIQRFKNLSIDYLIHNDASSFIRIINPIIAFLMFIKNPLIGVGGGFYPKNYAAYVSEYFPFGFEIYGGENEIYDTAMSWTANSKCLYLRVFAECGLVAILFIAFLVLLVKRGNKSKPNKYIYLWLVVTLVLMLQFDSYCYLPFLIFIAFYSNLRKQELGAQND